MSDRIALDLGLATIERLIPQRPPLLLIDRLLFFEPGRTPRVRCARHLGSEEPVFAGHFPGYPLWPGAYMVEGLGQAANLLSALDAIAQAVGAAELASALAHPTSLEALGPPKIGMSAAIDVKLLEPVFAGATVEYDVRRTHVLAEAARFAVEAWVDGRPVARGSITGSTRLQPPGRFPR